MSMVYDDRDQRRLVPGSGHSPKLTNHVISSPTFPGSFLLKLLSTSINTPTQKKKKRAWIYQLPWRGYLCFLRFRWPWTELLLLCQKHTLAKLTSCVFGHVDKKVTYKWKVHKLDGYPYDHILGHWSIKINKLLSLIWIGFGSYLNLNYA